MIATVQTKIGTYIQTVQNHNWLGCANIHYRGRAVCNVLIRRYTDTSSAIGCRQSHNHAVQYSTTYIMIAVAKSTADFASSFHFHSANHVDDNTKSDTTIARISGHLSSTTTFLVLHSHKVQLYSLWSQSTINYVPGFLHDLLCKSRTFHFLGQLDFIITQSINKRIKAPTKNVAGPTS